MSDKAQKDKSLYPHWFKERVRYGDLDPVGHVNNSFYATYFETARVQYFKEIKEDPSHDFDFALVQLNISFLKELHFDQEIEIGLKIGKIGGSSIEIFTAIFSGETCHATAHTVSAFFDKKKRKAVRIPDDIRKFLET